MSPKNKNLPDWLGSLAGELFDVGLTASTFMQSLAAEALAFSVMVSLTGQISLTPGRMYRYNL